MAADRASGQYSNDYFLTCSLCSKPYNNDDHQAKFLPCLHIFCKACLQNKAGDSSSLDCQKCEKKINLPNGTVDGLPDNFLVQNLQQYQDLMNKVQSCGNCDRGNPAVRFCEDCDCFQCQICVENYSSMRSLKNHKLSAMAEELQEQQSLPVQHQTCTKHEAQNMNRYCKEETCRVLACALCCRNDHQGHDVVELELAAKEIKTNMHYSSSRVSDRHRELQNKRDALEIAQKNLTSGLKTQEAEIEKSKKILHDLIDSSCSKAQANLKQMYDGEMQRLTEHIESMDFVAAQMTAACEFTNKACDVTPSVELITYHHQIMARLQQLENKQLPEVVAKRTKFAFTGKHLSFMKETQNSLSNFCDSDWKLQVDPSRCTILSNERSTEQGMRNYYEIIIQTADMYGENLTVGGLKIELTTPNYNCFLKKDESTSFRLTDNGDGTYMHRYHVEHYTKFNASICVTINGTHIKGSPRTL